MEEIDYGICPECGLDEHTTTYDDWIWDYGYTTRICEACNIKYKVVFKIVATKVVYDKEKQNG